MESDLPTRAQPRSTMIVTFTSAVLQAVGAGTKEYTIVYGVLFYFFFIHPLVSPSNIIAHLNITVDNTSALFNDHRDILIAEEMRLTELRADVLTLIREDREASQQVSVTSAHSLMIYAFEKKNTWKKALQYDKDINELKARMEIILLKDAEEHGRLLVERHRVSRQGIFARAGQFFSVM
ncbi:hypothetical protein EV421DRAFT_2042993 [Armillaria borealis]|uniref:Uncharacterized protein n=1 Tax=Armillaria borealis TaxID=47425 RepID=A0AA39M5U4_9AGAR|nr:hypothetical protein EV421DRAFT_2042993 [Armillaria borealis]